MQFIDPIQSIKGIGEKKAKLFQKLGIRTVLDLLEYYPRDYKDRSQITKIADMKPGEQYTLLCRIKEAPQNIRIHRMALTKVRVSDGSGELEMIWFQRPYMKNMLTVGEYYFFVGALESRRGKHLGRPAVQNAEFEKYSEEESLSYKRIVPVYRLTKGLTQKAFRSAIHTALTEADEAVEETLPRWILEENILCGRAFAVRNIHFPETNEAFMQARRRLCFDEFFILQTALYKFKNKHLKETTGFCLDASLDYTRIIKALPFTLTDAQRRVLAEIQADMSSGLSMNRLIQGDVGSGKTAVATCAAFWAIQNGYQVAMMAPTEVLAAQHLQSFTELFAPFGVSTVLLNGSMKKKERDEVLDQICSGQAKMIIGTHAVIQKTVIFNKLGLVITDEQHRFGVKQREALTGKGQSPHCLVMTATPIPRTLALILYGDLDISIIDALPPGRQKIDTLLVTESHRKRMYGFIEKNVRQGRQAYIICPAIEQKDDDEPKSKAELRYLQEHIKELEHNVFRALVIRGLHGKMKPADKQAVMAEFARGQVDILISTTVIEVGVNVPNATIMVVENAERFGLSQLHQLRGRVGRGAEKSYCILVSDSESEVAKERLRVMKETTDGFVISEMDLKLRGSGDFFGTRQHGLPEMKIANLFKDLELLKMAEKSAQRLIDADPYLVQEENRRISETIDKMFKEIRFGLHL